MFAPTNSSYFDDFRDLRTKDSPRTEDVTRFKIRMNQNRKSVRQHVVDEAGLRRHSYRIQAPSNNDLQGRNLRRSSDKSFFSFDISLDQRCLLKDGKDNDKRNCGNMYQWYIVSR